MSQKQSSESWKLTLRGRRIRGWLEKSNFKITSKKVETAGINFHAKFIHLTSVVFQISIIARKVYSGETWVTKWFEFLQCIYTKKSTLSLLQTKVRSKKLKWI